MSDKDTVAKDILDLKVMMQELTALANQVLARTEVIAERLAPELKAPSEP